MNDQKIAGFASLGQDINKLEKEYDGEIDEGIVSEKLPELELSMSNDDIIKLTTKWEKDWKDSPKQAEWLKQIKENEEYWLGKQFNTPTADKSRPPVDNLIFESLETYLPQTTRRNPEPLVKLNSKDAKKIPTATEEDYVEKVKDRLTDIADETKLRLKLKKAVRHWAIYQLGVGKFGWDLDKDIPTLKIIRPKRIILDPNASIDEDGYNGNRIGEHRKLEAKRLIDIIGGGKGSAEAKKAVEEKVKGDTATEIGFIEWWTPEYICWTMDKTVLLKKKNPHWNYDKSSDDTAVDTYGNETPTTKEVVGVNHFPVPKMPYSFLSVFNLGDQPMDRTSLIQQNLANQDLINKRNKQIDKNVDKMNGGAVVSLERSGLTQGQAKNVVTAIRKGSAIIIPSGAPQDAVYFPPVPSLSNDVYNQLVDTRSRTRDIFGTAGSTPAGVKQEDTVRGKIQIRGLDTDRIGGGVSEYLEQFADDIYNWFVQLLYVYDSEFQFIEGAEVPPLVISVKEGSLLPKDSISIANQALELAGMGKISNIDLYKRLDYPNPEELAANVWLETNAPHILFKDNPQVQEALGMLQQQEQQSTQETQMNKEEERQHEMDKERLKKADPMSGDSGSNLAQVPVT